MKHPIRRVVAVLAFALVGAIVFAACGGGGDDGGGGSSSSATIELIADNGIHDFVFDGAYSGFQLEADGGSSQSKKIDLKAGKYTFYCSIPGHRAAGMEGTLTVK
jgi:hypothetical protein